MRKMKTNYSNETLQAEYDEKYSITGSYNASGVSRRNEIRHTSLNLMVTDSDTGRPLARAMISIDSIGRTAICDNKGNVRLTGIRSGSYVLDVIVPGYIAACIITGVPANDLLELCVKMVRNS